MIDSVFFTDNQNFVMFGNEHLITFVFFVVTGALFIRWATTLPEKKQHQIGNIFAFSLFGKQPVLSILRLKGFILLVIFSISIKSSGIADSFVKSKNFIVRCRLLFFTIKRKCS